MAEVNLYTTVCIQDTCFLDREWKTERYVFELSNPNCFFDPKSVFNSGHIATGGSKGSSFRQTIHEWGNTEKHANKHAYVAVCHILQKNFGMEDFSIENVDFSFDLMSIVGDVLYTLVCQQGDHIFMARKQSCLIKKQSKWTSFSFKNLKATDFLNMNCRKRGNPNSGKNHIKKGDDRNSDQNVQDNIRVYPDFLSPKKIKFGYVTMNSTSQFKSQTVSGLDNFNVIAHCTFSERKQKELMEMKIQLKQEQKLHQLALLQIEKMKKDFNRLEKDLKESESKLSKFKELKDMDFVSIEYEDDDECEDMKNRTYNNIARRHLLIDDYIQSPDTSKSQNISITMIRHIVSFVSNDPYTLCKLSQVNSTWQRIASSDYLWKSLCFSNFSNASFDHHKPYKFQYAQLHVKEYGVDETEYIQINVNEEDSQKENTVDLMKPSVNKKRAIILKESYLDHQEDLQIQAQEPAEEEWEILKESLYI